MQAFPGRHSVATITAMSADELLDAELASHARFVELDGIERRTKGTKYNLMKGPAELMNAWDEWGRLTRAANSRSLTPRRLPRAG